MKKLLILSLVCLLIPYQLFSQSNQFSNILQIGSTDSETSLDVTKLQNFLYPKYLASKPTGYFGPLTEKALKKYQSELKLKQTGILDVETGASINKSLQQQETKKNLQVVNDNKKCAFTVTSILKNNKETLEYSDDLNKGLANRSEGGLFSRYKNLKSLLEKSKICINDTDLKSIQTTLTKIESQINISKISLEQESYKRMSDDLKNISMEYVEPTADSNLGSIVVKNNSKQTIKLDSFNISLEGKLSASKISLLVSDSNNIQIVAGNLKGPNVFTNPALLKVPSAKSQEVKSGEAKTYKVKIFAGYTPMTVKPKVTIGFQTLEGIKTSVTVTGTAVKLNQ